MNYTLLALIGAGVAITIDLLVVRTRLLLNRGFWTAYAIVLFFQLVTNGVLTGLPVVRYDAHRILGLRIAWAPVEDLLFGFAMVTITLCGWVRLGERGTREPHR